MKHRWESRTFENRIHHLQPQTYEYNWLTWSGREWYCGAGACIMFVNRSKSSSRKSASIPGSSLASSSFSFSFLKSSESVSVLIEDNDCQKSTYENINFNFALVFARLNIGAKKAINFFLPGNDQLHSDQSIAEFLPKKTQNRRSQEVGGYHRRRWNEHLLLYFYLRYYVPLDLNRWIFQPIKTSRISSIAQRVRTYSRTNRPSGDEIKSNVSATPSSPFVLIFINQFSNRGVLKN